MPDKILGYGQRCHSCEPRIGYGAGAGIQCTERIKITLDPGFHRGEEYGVIFSWFPSSVIVGNVMRHKKDEF
jgi:hypothetical protein